MATLMLLGFAAALAVTLLAVVVIGVLSGVSAAD
jgi:hypothetical protein